MSMFQLPLLLISLWIVSDTFSISDLILLGSLLDKAADAEMNDVDPVMTVNPSILEDKGSRNRVLLIPCLPSKEKFCLLNEGITINRHGCFPLVFAFETGIL